MQRINCLRINPFNHDEMISCCEDGTYAVWSLSKFQLKHFFRISNFLKEVHFLDELKIRLLGSGDIIYECFICDGIVKKEIEVIGSCINTAAECFIDSTGEKLLFFGGDVPQLTYFDLEAKTVQLQKMESYG
jgi:hypothetical protein